MDESHRATALPSAAPPDSEAVSKRRILVVDHDASTRRILQTTLETAQNDVIVAKSAAEAHDLLRTEKPFNIIVCSLSQAAARDCASIAKIRAGGERAPILAIASQWKLESLARALEAGADDWLQKPFDLNELRRSVSLLSSRALERVQGADKLVQYYEAQVSWSEHNGVATLEVTAPTLSAQIDGFERFVERLAASNLTQTESMYLHMALEELVQNAKEWGNRFDPKKNIRLGLRMAPDRIVLRIEDEGEGFDPASVPDPSIDPKEHIRRRLQSGKRMGGWGLFIARKRMDELSFNETGTAAYITKFLAKVNTRIIEVPREPETNIQVRRKSSRKALETRRFNR